MSAMEKDLHKRLEEVLAMISQTAVKAPVLKKDETSLDFFYTTRDSYTRRGKQVLKYEFNTELYQEYGLIIVPITDVHLGNRHANAPYFKAFVDYILHTPNCVTILNGDLAETATKDSVGAAMFEENANIPEQLATLHEMLKPLVDAGKILGMGPGNHEQRVENLIGINPMQLLAEKLGVPYFGHQGFFKIIVNGIHYNCAFHHGTGGGGTVGSKSSAAEKMNKVVIADLYFSGHTHGRQYHKDIIYQFDENEEDLVPLIRTYVVGGSFLEYWGGYSEMKALAPSITGAVRIELRPDKKDIRVFI
jgi:DNA polymerase II small subunit/DNA polymerase delta subunit B